MAAGLTVLAAAALGTFALAPSAPAVTAQGCGGEATSARADGTQLDRLTAPGPGATRNDPFRVDPDGTVRWKGQTDQVIQNGRWTLQAWPFTVTGTVRNGNGDTTRSGEDRVEDRLPLKLPGLYFVKVKLRGGDGATCTASGWVKITGNPAFTPLWFGGIVLMLAGVGGFASLLLSGTAAPAAASITGGHP